MHHNLAYSIKFGLVGLGLGLGLGCGGSNNQHNDAPITKKDAAQDAFTGDAAAAPLTLTSWEGGEIRLEWIQNGSNNTSRGTAFFYQSETPPTQMAPSFPGCIDARPPSIGGPSPQTWPLAQGAIVPLDVGDVIVTTSTEQVVFAKDATGLNQTTACGGTAAACTAPAVCMANGAPTTGAGFCATTDPLLRPHDLWYKKAQQTPAAGDGSFFPANESYNITFTGNDAYTSTGGVKMPSWPAQAYNNIGANEESGFMPGNWVPSNPAPCSGASPNQCGTGSSSVVIPAGADFVLGFGSDTSTNLPAAPYEQVNTAIAFKGTGFAGPLVLCQFDGDPATITIPKALIAILGAYTPGTMSRQHLTHHIIPLTDGQLAGFGEIIPGTAATTVPAADQQRIDILTVWCYTDPWSGGG
jgi:hypothetical protein